MRSCMILCSFALLVVHVGGSFRDERVLAALIQQHKAARGRVGTIPDAAARSAILALDTDGSGKVEKREVEAFAKQQGISADDFLVEFSALDTDGDGELSLEEIIGSAGSSSASSVAGPPTGEPVMEPAMQPVMPEQQAARKAQAGQHSADVIAVAEEVDPNPDKELPTFRQNATTHSPPADANAVLVTSEGTNVVAKAEAGASRASMLLNTSFVLSQARLDADSAIADQFTRSASSALQQETADEKKAAQLDVLAKKLRTQAEEIAQTAEQRTVAAASEAADKVLREVEPRVSEMEKRASELQQQAAVHRQNAVDAMDQVTKAQAKMRAAMQQP